MDAVAPFGILLAARRAAFRSQPRRAPFLPAAMSRAFLLAAAPRGLPLAAALVLVNNASMNMATRRASLSTLLGSTGRYSARREPILAFWPATRFTRPRRIDVQFSTTIGHGVNLLAWATSHGRTRSMLTLRSAEVGTTSHGLSVM